MDNSREELVVKIIELNPLLRSELDDLSKEELETLYEELQEKREQKREDLLEEIDGKKQLDEEDIKHFHDPNPPEPPIYEKPRPVPDPPIEEE